LKPDDGLGCHFNPDNGNMILQQKMAKSCFVIWIGTIIDYVIVDKAKVMLNSDELTEVPKYVYLRTAFTPVAPKSVRIQSSCQYLFTLLGSTGSKAAGRTLMKWTPGLNFTNIFTYSFYARSSQKRKNLIKLSVSFYAFGIYWLKSCW